MNRLERPAIFSVFFLTLIRALAALPWVDQPDDADASDIEQDHGRSVNAHVHDVSGWGENGGDHKEDEDRSPDVLEQELGAHHAHGSGKTKNNRQLKDQRQ